MNGSFITKFGEIIKYEIKGSAIFINYENGVMSCIAIKILYGEDELWRCYISLELYDYFVSLLGKYKVFL